MRIKTIQALDNFVLKITTKDGIDGLFDVKPYLQSEAFQSLKQEDNFSKVRNYDYYIEWENGADLSADTIGCSMKKVSQ
ncbi:hypothetical protein SPONN_2523 [uncultured Candidatus Thioglobus sp.]|nr:hypothetical protein SPONN_2523 [uncultured Candidatus Thioglobus sp.]